VVHGPREGGRLPRRAGGGGLTQQVPPLLRELLRAPGPSGAEHAVAAIVRREAASLGADVETDVLGSTVARVAGNAGGRLLALFAHADQVGLAVRRVRGDGLLEVAKLANWSPAAVLHQRVEILAADARVPGVVTRSGSGEPEWRDLLVDVGASSEQEALGLVSPGDPAVPVGPPLALAGGRLAAAALDDRAGVYAALEALRALAADPPAWDVALVVTSQEETGTHGGAAAATERLRPDAALVVETTFAGDAPGGPDPWGDVRLGGGPVVFRGPVVHPGVVAGLLAAAADTQIPVAVEAGASTWSDADDVFVAAGGVAAALVSIPLRFMHTTCEVVQLSDVEATARLLEAYARRLEPGLDLRR
jgi:endoglucanase